MCLFLYPALFGFTWKYPHLLENSTFFGMLIQLLFIFLLFPCGVIVLSYFSNIDNYSDKAIRSEYNDLKHCSIILILLFGLILFTIFFHSTASRLVDTLDQYGPNHGLA